MNKPIRWNSRVSFIFATAAAAIGLGNVWRFPYLAGQYGGGAFVLVYIFFVIILGIPLMTSEVMSGRIGRSNPVNSIANVAKLVNRSRYWGLLGGLSVLAAFLILTYYMVISGWVFDYFVRALLGHFKHATELTAIVNFKKLQSSPLQMLFSDSFVTFATVGVIAFGIKRGLERTVMIMFPALVIIMLVLLGYAMTTGGFRQGVVFLFRPDFYALTPKIVLVALGQAFFSLNIAMGIIIMFSAYLPDETPVMSSVVAVCFSDTAIAILAGLVIFPIVFANHLQAASGPSLIFKTLPIAFGHLPFGNIIGALFFLLLLFAAFTSTISLIEPAVSWLMEKFNLSRTKSVMLAGITCWILSFGTIASFSHASQIHIHGITFFKAIDFLTSAIMLPLGGLLIAIFTGWLLPTQTIHDQLGWNVNTGWFKTWRWIKRYFAPIAIVLILLSSFGIFNHV